MTTIELDGVSKSYGDASALDDVSLAVDDGEFFTLVGPSGCGKTTTLRLIAGFETPSTGTVRLDGEDVRGVSPEDRDVGVVFQNYALFPHMTVEENVGYGLRFREPPGGVTTGERIEELLDLVDLAGMGARTPDELSGGQQQRVALARALAPGPRVLLLDEPMSALDAGLRERLRLQVAEIQSAFDVTTVYVTHDQEEALSISDRIAVMNDGRIEETGTPRELYRHPSSEFVARFLGDNNVLSGTVLELSGIAGETEGITVAVDGAEFELQRTDVHRPIREGDRITFCARPDGLTVVRSGADRPANRIKATVESAEFLGETTRVHLDWNGRELILRTTEPITGTVEVGFAPADAHVVSVDRTNPNPADRTEDERAASGNDTDGH